MAGADCLRAASAGLKIEGSAGSIALTTNGTSEEDASDTEFLISVNEIIDQIKI